MALEPTGVEYIGKGFQKFITELGQAEKAIVSVGNMTKNKLIALNMLADTSVKVANAMARVATAGNRLAVVETQLQINEVKLQIEEVKLNQIKEKRLLLTDQISAKEEAAAAKAQAAAEKQAKAAQKAAEAARLTATQAMTAIGGIAGGNIAGAATAISGGQAGMFVQMLPTLLKMTSVGGLATGIKNATSTIGMLFNVILGPGKLAVGVLKEIGTITAGVVSFGIKTLGAGVEFLGNVFNFITAPMRSFIDGLGQIVRYALGYGLGNVFIKIGQAVNQMATDMITGATEMQTLRIRFEGLIAGEIQSSRTTLNFAQAMAQAVRPTQELIDWINILAVKSPFEREVIANTVALGMAMGFTTGEAKRTTRALNDWASGMGLGNDAIQLILYNFGQMRAQGKLTGQELRDAARGGLIPVMEILKQMGVEAGKTGKDLEDAMRRPAEVWNRPEDVQRFLDIFIDMAERRFPNAAERMSRTWQGVTNNIKDFIKTVVGADVLEPVMNRIAGRMADALNNLLSPAARSGAKAIGESLGYAFDKIWGSIQRVLRSVSSLAEALGLPVYNAYDLAGAIEYVADVISVWLDKAAVKVYEFAEDVSNFFDQTATNALTYGKNTAIEWANGFIQGIETAILKAINWLNSVLESWLGPGSPPRAIPRIDQWGQKAMEEWLKGFTEADFSVIESMEGKIKSALDALVGLGQISEGGAANLYKKYIKALAKGLAGGGFDTNFFKKLAKDLGPFGSSIVELMKRQLEYAKATEQAANAEKALKAAQEATVAQRTKVTGLIRAYNTALRGGAGRGELAIRLAEINGEEKKLALAQDQQKAAEEANKVAQERMQSLKDMVSLQEKLVDQMLELAKASEVKLDVTDAISSLGALGAAADGAGQDLADLDADMAALAKRAEDHASQWEDSGTDIGVAIQTAKTKFDESVTSMSDTWKKFYDDNFDTSNSASKAGQIKIGLDTLGENFLKFYQKYLDPYTASTPMFKMIEAWNKFKGKLDEISNWFNTVTGIIVPILITLGVTMAILLAPIIAPFLVFLAAVNGIVAALKWISEHPIKLPSVPEPGGEGATHNCNRGYHWDNTVMRCVPDSAQEGGTASAGTVKKVGEQGWEYFVPQTKGYIIPHDISSAVASLMQRFAMNNVPVYTGGGASSGPVTYMKVVNINFNGVNINNGMDLATVSAVIHREVMRDLSK